MIIEKEILFNGSLGESKLNAIFDFGASYSCIGEKHAQNLGIIESLRHPFKVETTSNGFFIEVKSAVRLDFYLDDNHFSDEFIIIPNLSEDVIIGTATMQKWRFKFDFEHDKVIIDPKVTRLRLI
jgi:hypothetical protein